MVRTSWRSRSSGKRILGQMRQRRLSPCCFIDCKWLQCCLPSPNPHTKTLSLSLSLLSLSYNRYKIDRQIANSWLTVGDGSSALQCIFDIFWYYHYLCAVCLIAIFSNLYMNVCHAASTSHPQVYYSLLFCSQSLACSAMVAEEGAEHLGTLLTITQISTASPQMRMHFRLIKIASKILLVGTASWLMCTEWLKGSKRYVSWLCHVEKASYGVMVSSIPCCKECRPTTTATELFVSNQMEPIW